MPDTNGDNGKGGSKEVEILDTKGVERNGVVITLEKYQSNTKKNWRIQNPEDVDVQDFVTWIGPNVMTVLSGAFQGKLNLWTHFGPKSKDPDEALFEKLANDSLASRSSGGAGLKNLKVKVEKYRQALRDRGLTDEEIDDLL